MDATPSKSPPRKRRRYRLSLDRRKGKRKGKENRQLHSTPAKYAEVSANITSPAVTPIKKRTRVTDHKILDLTDQRNASHSNGMCYLCGKNITCDSNITHECDTSCGLCMVCGNIVNTPTAENTSISLEVIDTIEFESGQVSQSSAFTTPVSTSESSVRRSQGPAGQVSQSSAFTTLVSTSASSVRHPSSRAQ